MFTILKRTVDSVLAPHQDIFPRPTPWRIAFVSWFDFLIRCNTYQFVYIPRRLNGLDAYDVILESNHVYIKQGEDVVYTTPVHEMTWQIWWTYVFESWAFGLFFSFWNWRWESGKLTHRELQSRVERLERKIQEKTRRIEQDDDEEEDE